MAESSSFPWCTLTLNGLFYEADPTCLADIEGAHPRWIIGQNTDTRSDIGVKMVFAEGAPLVVPPCDASDIVYTMPYILDALQDADQTLELPDIPDCVTELHIAEVLDFPNMIADGVAEITSSVSEVATFGVTDASAITALVADY